MYDLGLLMAAGAAGYSGLWLLAISQAQHWKALTGSPGPPPSWAPWMRTSGTLLLALSYTLALRRDGPAFGSVLSVFVLSAAGIAVAFTLAWQRRRSRS